MQTREIKPDAILTKKAQPQIVKKFARRKSPLKKRPAKLYWAEDSNNDVFDEDEDIAHKDADDEEKSLQQNLFEESSEEHDLKQKHNEELSEDSKDFSDLVDGDATFQNMSNKDDNVEDDDENDERRWQWQCRKYEG